MNTIPSIFNERKISYTVFGGSEQPSRVTMDVTCIVLSRNGRHYRSMVIENLLAKGFEKIISVNPKSEQVSVEQLARHFPTVEFLVALENVSQGELLNIAFAHAKSEYVFVVQEEMCSEKINFTSSLAEKLIEKNQFCVVPRLASSSSLKLPVVFTPLTKKSVFTVEMENAVGDNHKTLYSFDYAGFYNREKFSLLGGIDYTITSPYWQKLDFFMRAWLWGEKITVSNSMEFTYADSIPEEDRTVELSYLRFYLKNLLPVFISDHAKILRRSFLTFKLRNSCGFVESLKQFKDAVRWTCENQYRFKTDAVALIENWSKV